MGPASDVVNLTSPATWAALAGLLPEEACPAQWDPGTSRLTASGVPMEASLSVASTDNRLHVRVVVDPGAGHPPEATTAAGLTAAHAAGRLLEPPGRAVVEELVGALGASPWDTSAPWAVWVGASTGGGPSVAVKVYARLTDRAALDRLARRGGAATAALARVLVALPGDLPADWCFAGWDVASDGAVSAKVYLTARSGQQHAILSWVARPLAIDTGGVLEALNRYGLGRALWTGRMILAAGRSDNGWRLGVHAAPPADQPDRWRLAKALGAGVEGWNATLDDLAATAGTGLHVSWLALGFVPPGHVARKTVYLAPT